MWGQSFVLSVLYLPLKTVCIGKMLKLLRDMYSNAMSSVKTTQSFTKQFECKFRVRQGCLLSPELFILFINELERMLKLSELRGIHIWKATEVLLLMYADDIVLVGETIIQLQRK